MNQNANFGSFIDELSKVTRLSFIFSDNYFWKEMMMMMTLIWLFGRFVFVEVSVGKFSNGCEWLNRDK